MGCETEWFYVRGDLHCIKMKVRHSYNCFCRTSLLSQLFLEGEGWFRTYAAFRYAIDKYIEETQENYEVYMKLHQ